MPDAKSHIVGIATLENDTIVEIVEFTHPVGLRISNRFAGRLAAHRSDIEMMADGRQLERELAALLQRTKSRAA
mgnify:CR=1 FL=1